VPSWLGAVGQWTAIPGSSFTGSAVGWAGTSPNAGGASGNYVEVIAAWSSAVLASDGVFRAGAYVSGPHLVPWGGGHNNYGGNELYAFGPFTSNAPSWARLTDPTLPAPQAVARDANGRPPSRHTYDELQYSSATKKMFSIGCGAAFSNGNSINSGDTFDFTVNPATTNPWKGIDSLVHAQGSVGYIKYKSAVDHVSGYIWGIGIGNSCWLTKLDPSTMTSAHYPIDNPNDDAYTSAAIDPVHHIMVWQGNSVMLGCDLRNPGAGAKVFTISTTGSAPGFNNILSLEWDDVKARFIGWNNNGKTLYFLTPSSSPYAGGTAWSWSSVTPTTGDTPADVHLDAQDGRLIVGRARIVEGGSWRGYVVMPNETDPLCIFRLG